jgi:MoxR-like ATPase
MDKSALASRVNNVVANVEKVIFGKHHAVELALVALVCRGHILVEDVPGTGKTVLAKAIARSLGCSFRRIQFTPDLLPSDVTGVSIFNQRTSTFEFRPGPIMAQIVLADEINRATPKTQSALLEAMEEHQVTVDGTTYQLPAPFLVMATQNPIEYEGTFPLPEAQLDRFFIRLQLGYPKDKEEIAIIDAQRVIHPLETIEQVISAEELLEAQAAVKDIHVAAQVKSYVVAIVNATRSHPDVYLGASPRGSLALARASAAFAMLQGRVFVLPDDVKQLAAPTLSHRLILQPQARLKDLAATTVIAEVLASVPVELSPTAARA